MNVYAFAKKIPGGYSVVSLAHPQYDTESVGRFCSETGIPIIVSSDGYDCLNDLKDRATGMTAIFTEKIEAVIDQFIEEVNKALTEGQGQFNLELIQDEIAALEAVNLFKRKMMETSLQMPQNTRYPIQAASLLCNIVAGVATPEEKKLFESRGQKVNPPAPETEDFQCSGDVGGEFEEVINFFRKPGYRPVVVG